MNYKCQTCGLSKAEKYFDNGRCPRCGSTDIEKIMCGKYSLQAGTKQEDSI